MSRPVATIVIPLLRQRDAWLERAVGSALEQSVPVEVLVIISAHTPPSNHEILERCRVASSGKLVVAMRRRNGFPNAINTGIGLATTDRVGLLLSDDWLDRDAIENTVAIDADIVSTGATRYDADGTMIPHLRRVLDPARFAARETLEGRADYLTHFLLFRKSRLDEVGGVDESLGNAPGIDDYDLVWTLLERGATVGMTSRPFYNFTIHDGERLTMRNREEQIRTLGKIFDKPGLHGEERERRLAEHARWFGRPETEVWEELHGAPS